MKINAAISFLLPIVLWFCAINAIGQETLSPLKYNGTVTKVAKSKGILSRNIERKTSVSLPFFEDFTGYSPLPDTANWLDAEVYINNTMCVSPVSRGVATFDGLNKNGIPYDSFSNTDLRYCDSLTSVPINLSADSVGDSVYLSFYFQPQGNGYYPIPQDSFILYMKISFGDWIRVWATGGDTMQAFQQVLVPLNNPLYFFDSFQFRFVNKQEYNNTDAVWNLDYIYLNAARSMYDTGIKDVAFTNNPSCMLNDYTYMPYRQFIANPAGEMAATISDSIKNSTVTPYATNYFFNAQNLTTGSSLLSVTPSPVTLNSYSSTSVSVPLTAYTFPALGGLYDRVTFQNTLAFQDVGVGYTANDTIVSEQIFDNYLAYDDGTCEYGDYLTMDATEQGLIAIEFHLNAPDTLQGVAIYFARQVPIPTDFFFDFFIYSSINGINGGTVDDTLFEEDGFIPSYFDTVNHYWVYKLYRPVHLPAGTFYLVTRQEAGTNDQLIYFGLDVNRVGPSHRWTNTTGLIGWEPSPYNGALMIRPLLGQAVTSSSLKKIESLYRKMEVSPNPAHDVINIQFDGDGTGVYSIANMAGKIVQEGKTMSNENINISHLIPGAYIVKIVYNGVYGTPQKIIKL